MNNKLIKYLKRLTIFLIPFILLFLIYVLTDPFMIIYHYDNFNKRNYINKNRDYISTEMLISNSDRYKYDSFILGSSTSLAFAPSIWKKFINTNDLCFSFDASGENINGIWSKVNFLDKKGYQMKNVLVVLEDNTFETFINDIPIFMKHPRVFPSSWIYFHYASFLSFMEFKFITALSTHIITGKFYPFMEDILVSSAYHYDTITNEFYNTGLWEAIKKDSLGFYESRAGIFPKVSGKYVEYKSLINAEHKDMLEDMKNVFDKQETDYRIIITPGLNQVSFNRGDLAVLKEIYGKDLVFDFSGINEFTSNISDYTDSTHFKKNLAEKMLKIVYPSALADELSF